MENVRRGAQVGWILVGLLTGCGSRSSVLHPSSREAEGIAFLFWILTGICVIVWIITLSLGFYATRANQIPLASANKLVRVGTLSIAIVLTILVAGGVALLPAMIVPQRPAKLRIVINGERWWWRVRYEAPNSPVFEIANEVHLPVGQPVEFILRSANVIHSFWIPALGGKLDLIPGRENILTLNPTQTGVFRGMCAEFCGRGHATMTFQAIVESPEDFQAWLKLHSQ